MIVVTAVRKAGTCYVVTGVQQRFICSASKSHLSLMTFDDLQHFLADCGLPCSAYLILHHNGT